MDNKLNQVIDLWHESPLAPSGVVVVCDRPPSGTVNDVYLIEVSGERYIVRIRKPLANAFPRGWNQELASTCLAAAKGIAPEVVFHSTDPDAMIIRYAGEAKKDALSSPQIIHLGSRLAELHAIGVPEGLIPQHDYEKIIDDYTELALRNDVENSSVCEVAKELNELSSLFKDVPRAVLVHHDLVRENIVWFDGLPLFIDWEYATHGHPGFDICTLVDSFELDQKNQEKLVSVYKEFGGEASLGLTDIEAGVKFVRLLSELWLKAVAAQARFSL